jgi:toxin YxiD
MKLNSGTRQAPYFSHRDASGLWVVLFFLIFTLGGCQSEPQTAANRKNADAASPAGSAPSHDLSEDEAAGGHTLRKHVGRTDEQLQERLRSEHNISAASTYTDRETAERVVGTVLQQEQLRIHRWLERSGGHPNLALDYDGDPDHPIGRTLRRGEDHTEPCSHALVVLTFEPPAQYYVLTTYPECR